MNPPIFSDKPKIIACYSLYNEAGLICSSIDSIKHYVDEVYVSDGAYRLDKLSNDETDEIIGDCLTAIDNLDGLLWFNRPNLTEVDKRNELFSRVKEGHWIFWIDGDEVCVGDVKKGLDKIRHAYTDLCLVRVFNNGRAWTWIPRFIRSKSNFHLDPKHWIYNYDKEVIYDGRIVYIPYTEIDDFFIINCNALRGKDRQEEDLIYKEFMGIRNWDDTNKDPIKLEVKA